MARLPRLVLPGHAHCVVQRGHGSRPVFADAADRQAYLAALRSVAPVQQVQVLAWALQDQQVMLLVRPAAAAGLSSLMQSVGRRYVAAYNRRHDVKGTLWDGRFRCAPVEPGATLLQLMAWVDGQSGQAVGPADTSAAARLAGQPDALLVNPPEFWALGNTPFEREAAYRRLLADAPAPGQAADWQRAAWGGWAIGSTDFIDTLAQPAARPLRPRAPGRPRSAGGNFSVPD